MARYSLRQRVSFNQGLAKSGGTKGVRAKGYLQCVKDAQTASRIARRRAAQRAAGEGGKNK